MNIGKKQRPFWHWLLLFVALLALVGGALAVRKIYKKLEAPRLTKRAIALMQNGDHNGARLSLRQALVLDPANATAARLMAEIAEAANNPDAVTWRKRVLALQPQSIEAVLDFARAALRFKQPAAAEAALKGATFAAANADYHALLAEASAATGNQAAAVEHYGEALRLDPKNQQVRLRQAAAMLERGKPEDMAQARATLEELATDPQNTAPALRAMIKEAVTAGETDRALRMARNLIADPQATFADRLGFLDLLHRIASPELPDYLASLQTAAREHTEQIAALTAWMLSTRRAEQCLEWSRTFSAAEWASPNVCVAVAFAALAERDWKQLEALTGPGDWRQAEHIHLALHARALREQGDRDNFNKFWTAATTASRGRQHGTYELARLAANWGWQTESAKLFLDLIDDPVVGAEAARAALPDLAAQKDTANLWRAMGKLLEESPNNDAVANNFVMYSLLLRKDLLRAYKLAETLATKHPRDPQFVSTHAYALHLQGKSTAAIEAMNTLEPARLDAPDLAAYYGILLAATGDFARAGQYLDRGGKADLLPEESELIRKARAAAYEGNLVAASGTEQGADNQSAESVRLANRARALRERKDFDGFQAQWGAAVLAAQKEPHGSAELAKAISGWGWDLQYEQLLSSAMKDSKYGAWACRELWPRLIAKKATTELRAVSSQLLTFEPEDDVNAANFVRYSLLFKNDDLRASQLAQTLYKKHPNDPGIAASYAYSLSIHQRSAEARDIVNTLGPEAAKEPWIALYCAAVLTSAGELDRAKTLLDTATTGRNLLTEEEAMARKTRAALDKATAQTTPAPTGQ